MNNTLIKCKGLSKNYGKTRALSNVDLSLPAGAPIALIGPNGAGKTTLLSLLCGFIRATEGSVEVMGHKAGSNHAIRRLSALPQDASLDPHFTIAKQLQHYAQLRSVDKPAHEAQRVLELVQLTEKSTDKPEHLSHGMRKRVLLAQALIGDPDLILLDEPTAGIDPPNVKIIRELISAYADKATFIVSSHNLDELEKVCTTVVHLADGELRSVSPIDDVNNEGVLSIALRAEQRGAEDRTNVLNIETIESMQGVKSARLRGATDLVIEYDSENYPDTDIVILTYFANNKIRYRRISKGRSLEEQLFSDDEAR